MTDQKFSFQGFTLSALICSGLACGGNFLAVLLAVVADAVDSQMLFGIAGLLILSSALFALWAVIGGACSISSSVKKAWPILATVFGGLCLLWFFGCVVITFAN